ncbi:YcgN family cysteine cluster protein [Aestuariibacter halophilus]|uniref:YcgN family cysteine cluster protein n=1 Tax=Fluctibacter halophilus TaxID=226011 RepID=A0ABS8G6T8_9ALTE|nr:YcgN family cysteine cluster protein [Aestuariibacter halophilus]MCC2616255.1 YcgN family cysteine cluster protein [Aestuariibacter halophilus]
MTERFWEHKTLEQMTTQEWEAICDGCAKCCLHKFIDDEGADELAPTDHITEGEQIHYTNIVCALLDTKKCSCTRYAERSALVPDCVTLTKDNLKDIFFMPPSCSYRRLHEGRGLPSWHPLLNKGKKSAMHKAGMSVRGKTVSEAQVDLEHFEDYIALWPLEDIE